MFNPKLHQSNAFYQFQSLRGNKLDIQDLETTQPNTSSTVAKYEYNVLYLSLSKRGGHKRNEGSLKEGSPKEGSPKESSTKEGSPKKG
jgi:hypothetical protein